MKIKAILFAGLMVAVAIKAQGPNLITLNPGFELGSPAGWYMWIDEQSAGNAVFETVEGGHTGGYALQMTVKRPTREIWQIQMNLPEWEAKANTRYRLTFWAKGVAPVRVTVTDATKNYAYMTGFDGTLTAEWTKVTGEFTTGEQTGKGSVHVGVGMGRQAGAYQFDDFVVEEVGPAAAH